MFAKTETLSSQKKVRASLALRDGARERVGIVVPGHKSLRDVLNDDKPFLELEPDFGARFFLAKAEIARIEPDDKAEPVAGAGTSLDPARFDSPQPHVVLGIAVDAPADEVRRAYHDLAKAYHPDRMKSFDLPEPLMRLASHILQRVNAAYEALQNR